MTIQFQGMFPEANGKFNIMMLKDVQLKLELHVFIIIEYCCEIIYFEMTNEKLFPF